MNKKRTSPGRERAISELKLRLREFVADLLVSNVGASESAGLNASDVGCLCLLLQHGPIPAGRLAELTGLTSGAITGVVDRLEATGFATRRADPSDRRKVIVAPDASRVERDLIRHFANLRRAAPVEFYERYSAGEIAAITDFLSRLAQTGI